MSSARRAVHDERIFALQHEPLHAVGDAPHGGIGQLLLASEDACARDAPVDAFGGLLVRLELARGILGVGQLGPHDGQAIAAGDHVEPGARAAAAHLGIADHPPLDLVAHGPQAFHEVVPVVALARGVGHQELIAPGHHLTRVGHAVGGLAVGAHHLVQRDDAAGGRIALCHQLGPLQHLLHVLQRDDIVPGLACPAVHHPGQRADLLAARLAAQRLAVVGAVWGCMQQTHGLAARDGQRIYPANVFPVVPGLRVVDLVHADGVGVMVDGDVHMPADGLLDACTGTAATGKEVDHQLCRD